MAFNSTSWFDFSNNIEATPYGQAMSNLVASGNLEATVQSIL